MPELRNIRRLLRTAWEGELQAFAEEVVAYFETSGQAEGTINFDLETPETPGPVFVSEPLEDMGLPEVDAAEASLALPEESFRSVETADGGTLRSNVSTRIRRSALLGRVVRQDGDKSYTLELFPFGPSRQSVQVEVAIEGANRNVPVGTMVAPVIRIDELEIRQVESYKPDSRFDRAWIEVELLRRRHYFAPSKIVAPPLYWTVPFGSPALVQAGT